MKDNKQIAELLFPNTAHTAQYYIDKYKSRDLDANCMVTRFAPSPTGYVHMGSLLTAFYAYILAKQSNGVFILRIEDTDMERTVESGVQGIIDDLALFDIVANEGVDKELNSYGQYGSYIQSERKDIYIAFAKYLVETGQAYPCFCSKDEINQIRAVQEENKEVQIGYYGKYAKCRDLSFEQIKQNLEQNKKFVIRFKATANIGDRISFVDKLRGEIQMPDLINDVVILKSETMLPPYNFAHAVDDTLMGTTLAIRSNEWLNSTPEHIALFKALGFEPVDYAHVAFVQKIDEETGSKRKISKRKDPESAVQSIYQKGYVKGAVWEYLYTLANTNYEDWKLQNIDHGCDEFLIDVSKISLSGALFDINKFNDISKNYISKLTCEQLVELTLEWAEKFDIDFYNKINCNKNLVTKFLNIERQTPKPRKDIVCLQDVKGYCEYIFDDVFNDFDKSNFELVGEFDYDTYENVFNNYLNTFDVNAEKSDWFHNIKSFCDSCGFCADMKVYKKNPEQYLGSVATVCSIIRVALTTKQNTPDLYEICNLLGKNNMETRFRKFLNLLK